MESNEWNSITTDGWCRYKQVSAVLLHWVKKKKKKTERVGDE